MIKARINGIDCIVFHEERLSQEKAPSCYTYMYHIRHDENDWTELISIERFVFVNFFGTVFFRNPLELNGDGYMEIERFEWKHDYVKLMVNGTIFRKMFSL